MGGTFLDRLDERLRSGIRPLIKALAAPAVGFVSARRAPEGGFRGRLGGADLYYTDFALRILVLLGAAPEHFGPIARYVDRIREAPGDLVGTFGFLNAARLLRGQGFAIGLEGRGIEASLDRHRLPAGGFAAPGDVEPSIYHTFLGALCHDMLDRPMPGTEAAILGVKGLAGPDGGHRDRPAAGIGQTSSTAAALAFLSMRGSLTPGEAEAAAGFLIRMQAPDGGLRAQPSAAGGDLLSTFTGLVALAGVGAEALLCLPEVARFAASMHAPDGGFRSCAPDPEADIEYTYYGLGTLALLHAHLDGAGG